VEKRVYEYRKGDAPQHHTAKWFPPKFRAEGIKLDSYRPTTTIVPLPNHQDSAPRFMENI